jgi:hypothetical protein
VTAAYAASLGFLTVCSLVDIRRTGGVREHFGPSLAGQMEVARAAGRYADAEAVTDVPHYRAHPHALWALRQLLPPTEGVPVRSGYGLAIRYRSADPHTAAVALVERDRIPTSPAASAISPGETPILLSGPVGTVPDHPQPR